MDWNKFMHWQQMVKLLVAEGYMRATAEREANKLLKTDF